MASLHFKLEKLEAAVCGKSGKSTTSPRGVECADCLGMMIEAACDRLTLKQWRAVFGKARCRLCGKVMGSGTVCGECVADEAKHRYRPAK